MGDNKYKYANVVPLEGRNKSVDKISEFPRNIYGKGFINEQSNLPYQTLYPEAVRDKNINYIYGVEKTKHPSHFSRFSYPWCENGYCTGNHPGRYNTPPAFYKETDPIPENMAPPRFYTGKHISHFYNGSESYKRY